MLILKSIIFIPLIISILGDNSTKLRQLIVRIHGKSDSATVYYIGNDEEFLLDFIKNEVSIPISTFNADYTEGFTQCTNVLIVFQHHPHKADHHIYLKLLQNLFESLEVRKFAIITAKSVDILQQYCSFFGERKFTRIFGMLDNTSSYAYLPYADKSIQQLDESDHLPDALKNLNGFALRTTVQLDRPRAFWYPDKSGQKHIGGRFGQIFLQFLKRHNATFREILIKSSHKFFAHDVISATKNNVIDISMSPFYKQSNLDISYPVEIEEKVIMVPCNGYLDPIEYFQRPFKPIVWLWIGLTAVFMTITKIFLNWLTNSKLDIWDSFSKTYLTLLSSSSGKPIVSNYRLHLFVIFFGFIFERLYGIHFQSFLTAYIKIKQYDTIQDLAENNIPIMISKISWERVRNDVYPKGFDKIVVPTDTMEYIKQTLSMKNTSFAYVVEADRFRFLIGFQSLFRKTLFRKAREVVNSYCIGFLLAFNSPFKEILNDFIIEISQTGLIQKWDSDVLYQAKASGYHNDSNVYDVPNIEESHKPLTIHHLKFAWQYLVIGLALSTVVFVLEWVSSIVKKLKLI